MNALATILVAQAAAQREGKKLKLPDDRFADADLCDTDLRGLVVRSTKSSPRDFDGAKFDGSNLLGATFENVTFSGASFKGANLAEVKFIGCVLVDADFTDANLSGVTFEGCRLGRAKFPQIVRAQFKGCRLIDVNFSGRDLRLSTFVRCNLWGTNFENCDLRSCNFTDCDSGSKLVRITNFTGADLCGASMSLMTPFPIGMNALTMDGNTYTLIRSAAGAVDVWSDDTSLWYTFDTVRSTLPEKVASILAQMASA
jgi:uncharacterized protein YjbI with pentapeptide repeats